MSDFGDTERTRLYLVTPVDFDLDVFAPQLEAALHGGDVAALLIAADNAELVLAAASRLAPLAQQAGAASLIYQESRAVGRASADGLHLEGSVADLEAALERLRPHHIVGVGALCDRHGAMQAGELGPDYVFFGDLTKPQKPHAPQRDLDLAAWWSDLFEIPSVLLTGSDLENVEIVLETGTEFIAARDAVWTYNEGPAAAIQRINRMLDADAD